MTRIAAVVLCSLIALAPLPGHAQTAAASKAFTFCTVTDMSGGGMGTAKIWASPVFEFDYRADDGGGMSRTAELATEFHTFIGGMGGSGDKSCFPATQSRAELEALRAQQRKDWTKRIMLWASKWQEVAWTPKPWNPDAVVAKAAVSNKYFYCYVTDVEPDVRKTVASLVFEKPVRGDDPMAIYNQTDAYTEEFKRTALPGHGVSDQGTMCVFKDTLAEAEKSRKEYRRLFSGFNLRFVDLSWSPSGVGSPQPATPIVAATAVATDKPPAAQGRLGVAIDTVTDTLAQALGLQPARGAMVVQVIPGSAAEKSGLKPLDVVLEVAGQSVEKASDLPAIVARLRPSFKAPLQVWRERKMLELSVEIGSAADTPIPSAVAVVAVPPVSTNVATPMASAEPMYCFAEVNTRRDAWYSPIWTETRPGDMNTLVAAARDQFLAQVRSIAPDLPADAVTDSSCLPINSRTHGYGCSTTAGKNLHARVSCIADGHLMGLAWTGERRAWPKLHDVEWKPLP